MKIKVKVKTNAKKNEVVKLDDGSFIVEINAPPIEGRANEKLIDLLSEHFNKPKTSITIQSGLKSKTKLIKIE